MVNRGFALVAFALVSLHAASGSAQAPHDASRADILATSPPGPGVDTREPREHKQGEMTPASAKASAPEADQERPEPGGEPAVERANRPSDPATAGQAEQEAPRDGVSGPAAIARDAAGKSEEAAPVAQPLDPAQGPAQTPAAMSQAAGTASEEQARRPEDITITLATWQSAYNQAQQRALLEPFTEDTGYNLEVVRHGGDMSAVTAERARKGGWDLVELSAEAATRGCAEGWLASITPGALPKGVEGDSAEADYLPGALLPCAAASAAWSAVTVYDTRASLEQPPKSIAALFDLPQFPGARAFPKQAPYLLEFALMAEGVPPGDVYSVLATRAGQDRAFAKLSAIRHAIRWWENAAKALDLFAAGAPDIAEDVVMGIAFNGRVFTSVARAPGALRILWDGQIHQFNYWAIPESAPEPRAARALLRYVSLPERQARLTQWFPYGPPRKSALPLVGQHAEIDIDMAAFVPTMPRNMQTTLRFDPRFWQTHGTAIKQRFAAWLAQPKPSAPLDQLIPPTPVKAVRPRVEMTDR